MEFMSSMLGLFNRAAVSGTTVQQLGIILEEYVFPFCAVGGIVWALYIGVLFWQGKDEQSRTKARKRFFNAIATLIIILVLWAIMKGVNLGTGSVTPNDSQSY